MKKTSYILILIIALFLNGCNKSLHQAQLYVFGTLVGITVWGVPEGEANETFDIISKDLQSMHNQWHSWHKSPLNELNQTIAKGEVYTVTDNSLLPILIAAKELSLKSEGLFNPAIGQLIKLWGFHEDELKQDRLPPNNNKISQLLALAPTMNDLIIEDNKISSNNPALQLDLGAFAKGYAVDILIKKLRSLGIKNAIINLGGDLKAIGKKGKQSWFVGIRHPSGTGVLAAVVVNDGESVMTSGNYERFYKNKGKRYSHIIDPRNGKPATDFTSVTVIDTNGALADAAATALTVAGKQDWHQVATQMGVKYVMLVDQAGTVYFTPAMAKRVQFQPEQLPKIVISQ
jgi:thiamine biosynthesis lipoprotein